MPSPSPFVLCAAGAALLLSASCSDPHAGPAAPAKDPAVAANDAANVPASTLADKPLAPSQAELLELAFKAATAIPVDPHIKDRSRQQEDVVAACLELDQPQRALGYIEQIDNWRRGAAYADLAFHCVQHGDAAVAPRYLDEARRIAETVPYEEGQGWRRDRIRVKIARTHRLLGQLEQAAELEAGVVDSESGAIEAARALLTDGEGFDDRLASLAGLVETGSPDQAQGAFAGLVQLYDSFFEDQARRSRVEQQIDASLGKLPRTSGIHLLLEMAGHALEHGDQAAALDRVNRGQALMDEATWIAEDHVPLMARLAELRHRAGDEAKARVQADAALALFDAGRDTIMGIFRAGVLRPLAEAYHAMSDGATALLVYKRAVDEAMANPNARPRAEDLSATCRSMAVHGIEPDPALRALLAQVHEGLGPPW